MIPKIIHFVYGLSENFSNKPFCFFHYLAILSAKQVNSCEVFLHFKYEPKNNEWWDKAKSLVTLKEVVNIPVNVCGKRIIFAENKCDVLRLDILDQYGGIYLDIDTICNKPFDDLLKYDCVMGVECFDGKINGLCNAVILSTSQNQFIRKWMKRNENFEPRDWNLMAVRNPYQLSLENPELIHVENYNSFFKYDWHTIVDIFNDDAVFYNGYVIHLWESKLYHPILKHISQNSICEINSLYNILARRFL